MLDTHILLSNLVQLHHMKVTFKVFRLDGSYKIYTNTYFSKLSKEYILYISVKLFAIYKIEMQ